jgi:hypothetical protein
MRTNLGAMKCIACHSTVLGIALAFLLTTALRADATEDGFVSMFNGTDLSGWEGAPGWWEVRDGAIVAESTADKPSERTHYLYWKEGQPADFDLRCRFRISGAGANSGIHIRSQPRPNWDIWGYQADLDTDGVYTGCLYQHDRGLVAERGQKVVIDREGRKSITTFADSAALLEAVKDDDWNEYRIRARGPHIELWINGVLMCEVEDHEPAFALPKGIIALQMHAGPPMRVAFKDLRIRMLTAGGGLR